MYGNYNIRPPYGGPEDRDLAPDGDIRWLIDTWDYSVDAEGVPEWHVSPPGGIDSQGRHRVEAGCRSWPRVLLVTTKIDDICSL